MLEPQIPQVEFDQTMERLTPFERSFTGVGVSEMHAIAYVLMAINEGPFSQKDLMKLFYQAQGEELVWKTGPNVQFRYSQNTFVPAGLAQMNIETRNLINRHEPVDVNVTEIIGSKEDITRTLAVCGALLEWGLSDGAANLVQRKVFGSTHNKEGEETTVGSTLLRKAILKGVLAQPGTSETALVKTLGMSGVEPDILRDLLSDFVKDNILIKEDAADLEKRSFELTGDGYKHPAIKREQLAPEARAVYDMADIFAVSGYETVSAAQLFDAIVEQQPDMDQTKLRFVLVKALADEKEYVQGGKPKVTKNIPVLISVDGSFNEGARTKYTINPDCADSIKELLNSLDLIETGDPNALNEYAEKAVQMLNKPTYIRHLVFKAKNSSPFKNFLSNQEFFGLLQKAVADQDQPLSLHDAFQALKERGLKMRIGGVRNKINQLEKDDLVLTDMLARDKRTKKLVTHIIAIADKYEPTSRG